MTKPTDEERREVAAKLRALADAYGNTSAWSMIACGELPAPIDDVMQACGLGRIVHAAEICAHLADLIEHEERESRAEQDYKAMEYGIPDCRTWRCECGSRFPFWRGGVPCYCPGCGAKVVDE